MMSIMKMRGPIYVLFAFKIFSLPVPTHPGTRTFWQVPDPIRPEVKTPTRRALVLGHFLCTSAECPKKVVNRIFRTMLED